MKKIALPTTGPQIEVMYRLMTFGILVQDSLPITADGALDLSSHLRMMATWKRREEQKEKRALVLATASASLSSTEPPTEDISSEEKGYVIPGSMDIMLGRGRHPNSSPGTVRLHIMLHQHNVEYETATRFEKTILAETILRDMKDSGIRFLKLAACGFEVCDDSVARAKISHGFRNMRLRIRRNDNNSKSGGGGGAGECVGAGAASKRGLER
jgi:hypothetical protein